jgi:two-component system sensor histidine kinase KdpD
VVAQITRIHVRETVPDKILDEASDIELVDTTADDLLQRLREGKVYVKAQAERALRHFFSPGNLTALRELALRRTAQRVDRDVNEFTQARSIGGPAGERILVCVNEHPSSAELVRRAKRMADAAGAAWSALYVESARHIGLGEPAKDRVADALRLAARLGAETATVPGRDIAQTILDFARKTGVTQILIGKSQRSRWFEILHGSVVRDLMRESGAIGVTAVMAQGEAIAAKTVATERAGEGRTWPSYGWSVLAVASTVAVAWAFNAIMAHAVGSIAMFFLVPVLLIAISFGLRPALATAFLSVMAYNFFFLPPLYTFTIADPNNWLSFAVLLLVAITAANLTARVRAQANLAATRAQIAGELYQFTGKLAAIAQLDDILWAAAYQIASMLRMNVVILLPEPKTKRLEIRVGYPPEDELDAQDLAAAMWSWEKGAAAGRNADTLPGARRLFLPMRTGHGLVGVVGLLAKDGRGLLSPDERRLLDSLLDQTALAVERSLLAAEVDEAKVRAEADKLRVAMLSSLSHDLRTPLASILGASTTLLASKGLYDAQQTTELLATVRDEAERLDRFVGNLLDMSRLEAGVLGVKPEAAEVRDLVDAPLKRLSRQLSGRRVVVDIPGDLPLVKIDPLLAEQALFNILENAIKYSPPSSPLRLSAHGAQTHVALAVEDEGPGISANDLPHVFDKFYRAKSADSRTAGTGLGLAVARGFVEAFGGTLEAANRGAGGGARLTMTLPVAGASVDAR